MFFFSSSDKFTMLVFNIFLAPTAKGSFDFDMSDENGPTKCAKRLC
jgi:hypothetical protein